VNGESKFANKAKQTTSLCNNSIIVSSFSAKTFTEEISPSIDDPSRLIKSTAGLI
jgi:hypothetical protein